MSRARDPTGKFIKAPTNAQNESLSIALQQVNDVAQARGGLKTIGAIANAKPDPDIRTGFKVVAGLAAAAAVAVSGRYYWESINTSTAEVLADESILNNAEFFTDDDPMDVTYPSNASAIVSAEGQLQRSKVTSQLLNAKGGLNEFKENIAREAAGLTTIGDNDYSKTGAAKQFMEYVSGKTAAKKRFLPALNATLKQFDSIKTVVAENEANSAANITVQKDLESKLNQLTVERQRLVSDMEAFSREKDDIIRHQKITEAERNIKARENEIRTASGRLEEASKIKEKSDRKLKDSQIANDNLSKKVKDLQSKMDLVGQSIQRETYMTMPSDDVVNLREPSASRKHINQLSEASSSTSNGRTKERIPFVNGANFINLKREGASTAGITRAAKRNRRFRGESVESMRGVEFPDAPTGSIMAEFERDIARAQRNF